MQNYKRGQYDFVVDSNFTPFTMQEMLAPLSMYKDAYEKSEEAYTDLTDKADQFKYLSETLPEGSQARKIYEGYSNELNAQAQDLAQNGLNMGNRRALTNLKRRYQGEIGRLVSADAAMREERKLRRTMNAKDSSMLYAMDNLSIDDFMDGNTPNLYNISGTELYTRGAAAGKAASSRVYQAGDEGSTLGGYYRKWVERNGYSKESMDAFRANAATIPELQQAADAILAERGVTENLTGNNLERARQSVLNGIIDGAVYQESIKPVRDEGRMSAAQAASNALGWANHNESVRMHNLQLKMSGYDENGVYHPENDQTLKKAQAVAAAKGSSGGSRGGSTMKDTQTSGRVRLTWNGNNPNDTNGDADDDYTVEAVANDNTEHPGVLYSYDRLPTYVKKAIAPLVGDGKQHLYDYYFKPYEGGFFDDSEASVELVPRKIITQNRNGSTSDGGSDDGGLNDIPE